MAIPPCQSPITVQRKPRPLRPAIRRARLATRALMLVPALALAIVGCASAANDELSDLPTLDEVRSDVTPPAAPQAEQDQQRAQRPRVEIALEQIELPLDIPLSELWEYIDEDALDEPMRRAWNANGLRVGVVRAEQREPFAETLPEDLVLGVRRHRVSSRSERVALRGGPRLTEPVTVHGAPGAGAGQAYEAERGRLRLLGRAQIDRQGGRHIELVPQHHRRRHAVQPRHPREAELDGEIFESLAAVLTFSGHELLVVGLHDVWAERDADSSADQASDRDEDADESPSASDSETDPEVEPEPEPERRFELRRSEADADAPPTLAELRRQWQQTHGERPELPDHFGRSVLTRERAEHRIQVLMILSVHPAATRRAGRE